MSVRESGGRELLSRIVNLVFVLRYANVCVKCFSSIPCDKYDDGIRVLRVDRSIDCDSVEHKAYQVYAGFMMIIYPIGIPALYFTLVYVSRKDVNPDPLEVLEDCITGMTGGHSKFELTDDVRSLAFYGVELRRIAEEAKNNGELIAKSLNEKLQKEVCDKDATIAEIGSTSTQTQAKLDEVAFLTFVCTIVGATSPEWLNVLKRRLKYRCIFELK